MDGFFKGLRRKLGVLTLMMACLFVAAWGRSHISSHLLRIPVGDRIEYRAELARYGISLSKHQKIVEAVKPQGEIDITKETDVNKVVEFYVGRSRGYNILGRVVVPYWFAIIPLTLLSAGLLLTKPRQSTQKKIAEPIPEKVV